jgi:hypothetical protein
MDLQLLLDTAFLLHKFPNLFEHITLPCVPSPSRKGEALR